MAHGGKREGAGRRAGAASKHTKVRAAKVDEAAAKLEKAIPGAFKGDSHAFLMAVYKDPANPLDVRIDAAKAAIGYEKPRLQAVDLGSQKDKPLKMVVEWLSSESSSPTLHDDSSSPTINGHNGGHA